MRILLTGINGQVGWELQRTLQPLGSVIAVGHADLDLANPDRIRSVLRDIRPTVIVNPAAYTAVDKAESEPALATAINATAPGILAEEAKLLNALLVHYSTDYIFDGSKSTPYNEGDTPNPINVYGSSKLAGEQAIRSSGCRHLILRTSWVYGMRGRNFLRTMLQLAKDRDELSIVADQFGAPTWSRMIAETTALLLSRHREQEGVYHFTAGGETTWHGFAEEIFASALAAGQLERKPAVRRIASADFPSPAKRPINSRLDCSRLNSDFNLRLPAWQTQLALCLSI
jgi:dTDP-4-dehydrorhamnose reductase